MGDSLPQYRPLQGRHDGAVRRLRVRLPRPAVRVAAAARPTEAILHRGRREGVELCAVFGQSDNRKQPHRSQKV